MTNFNNEKEAHTGVIAEVDPMMIPIENDEEFWTEISEVEKRAKSYGEKYLQAAGQFTPRVIKLLGIYGFKCVLVHEPDTYYCQCTVQ